MNFSNDHLSLDDVKTLDMVSYLHSLGFEPSKVVHDDYWYLSPLRNEKTASFKINRRLNRWYDHGMGQGGNIIDFGILFFKCSIGEFLKEHRGNSTQYHSPVPVLDIPEQQQSKITILREKPLQSTVLLEYLKQRKIPLGLAFKFCSELSYSIRDHNYYGIGFKNDLGGFEIRNPYFKSSSSPKGITSYDNNNKEVVVFEGFMDFLSYKAMNYGLQEKKENFLILNSISFLDKARPFMEKHKLVQLYLDQDVPGQNATKRALDWGRKYHDQSALYKEHKDLNDWMINSRQTNSKKTKPGIKR
ncbi:DNA primase [Flavobacterium aquidurense]|uniref:toprim domain-containing protein n=1 Tax=Flavobacterium aquidurense TaxID=362413 RepID=UPI0009242ABE|nr:toprim domain-containing protein [Flavobacterium aquidurense]OXA69775.1 DNA primase [Flavobacterium aquidurense]SHH26237.1 Toprim-like [Flavobacterium frigidimaris]